MPSSIPMKMIRVSRCERMLSPIRPRGKHARFGGVRKLSLLAEATPSRKAGVLDLRKRIPARDGLSAGANRVRTLGPSHEDLADTRGGKGTGGRLTWSRRTPPFHRGDQRFESRLLQRRVR